MTTLQLYHIINITTGRPISAPGPVGHPGRSACPRAAKNPRSIDSGAFQFVYT
jgi:hypothetical protein